MCRERRVVEAPVEQIVVGTIDIPRRRWQIDGNLHPVALRLKIAIHGRRRLAAVAEERDEGAGG